MGLFRVRVGLFQHSMWDEDVQADTNEEAEGKVKTGVWQDEYTKKIRTSLEIEDEVYDAEELCEDCLNLIDDCACDEKEDAGD